MRATRPRACFSPPKAGNCDAVSLAHGSIALDEPILGLSTMRIASGIVRPASAFEFPRGWTWAWTGRPGPAGQEAIPQFATRRWIRSVRFCARAGTRERWQLVPTQTRSAPLCNFTAPALASTQAGRAAGPAYAMPAPSPSPLQPPASAVMAWSTTTPALGFPRLQGSSSSPQIPAIRLIVSDA